ncbi:MAG: hypothetical protein ACR2QC_12485 [Gammaproteobacteria bacterium]
MKKMWMVRAGEGGKYWSRFMSESEVGINFSVGKDVNGLSREEIESLYRRWRSSSRFTDRQIRYKAGVLFRFCGEFARGDRVLTCNPRKREYLVGRISERECKYQKLSGQGIRESWHFYAVRWDGNPVSYDDVSESFRKGMKPRFTIFSVQEKHQREILKKSGLA